MPPRRQKCRAHEHCMAWLFVAPSLLRPFSAFQMVFDIQLRSHFLALDSSCSAPVRFCSPDLVVSVTLRERELDSVDGHLHSQRVAGSLQQRDNDALLARPPPTAQPTFQTVSIDWSTRIDAVVM